MQRTEVNNIYVKKKNSKCTYKIQGLQLIYHYTKSLNKSIKKI